MVGAAWRDDRGARRSRRAREAAHALAGRAPGAGPLVFGALLVPLLAWGLAGCAPHQRTNLDYCDPAHGIDNCSAHGKVCNEQKYRCETAVGGGGDSGDSGDSGTMDGGLDQEQDLPMDTAVADGRGDGTVPDAARSCPACPASAPICNTSTGACRACAADPECAAATPLTPLCATGGGACVLCRLDSDCKGLSPATPLCLEARQCVACRSSGDCLASSPVCDSNHACGKCKEDSDCAGRSSAPACRLGDGACVECVKHADCKSPTKPVCGPGNVCAPCTSDQQCVDKLGADPGVCMLHTDGHCATDREVLYVRPVAGCLQSGAGAGTVATPFCQLNNATPAVSPTRSIVVVRPSGGAIALVPWTYSAPPAVSELTVIGQQGATIGPGTGVGITLSAGTVYLRGLRISGMLDAGIYVAPGATLKMNRCFVTDCNGGLFVNGAGFQITNSVFANNNLATIDSPGGTPIEYGGAYLGGLANKLAVFRFNTVFGNKGPGLVCGGTYPVKGLLVAGNSTAQVVTCDFDATTSEVPGTATIYDPKFDTTDTRNPYRLTAQSSCVNKGGSVSADAPLDDIDGNPRPWPPVTGMNDCGASEYQGP